MDSNASEMECATLVLIYLLITALYYNYNCVPMGFTCDLCNSSYNLLHI